MKEIKTTDYISEYEFRRTERPRYQTSSLRPLIQDRRLRKPDDSSYLESERTEKGRLGRMNRTNDRTAGEILPQTKERGSEEGNTRRKITNPKSDKRSRKQGLAHDSGIRKNVDQRKKRMETRENLLTINKGKSEKWSKRRKNGKDGDKKDVKKKAVRKVAGSLKSAIADMEKSASASWDTDQNWDSDSAWDFARDSAPMAKGFKKGIEEVINVIVKVIKAVAATTLLPIILIMTGCLLVVITVLWATSGSGGSWSGQSSPRNGVVTEKQIIYDGLMETFEGNEEAVIGVMCALMAESGCNPKATEAAGKWGISASEYTGLVNDGTVTKEEFVNSTYNGVQGSRGYGIAQWSTVDRKKALYEFAEKWAEEKGTDFDIGNIEMQVAHLQETINTTYATLKQALIGETDMEEACYKWIATYERPSEKYSTWREKAQRDVSSYAENLRAECENNGETGYFIWPCPSSNRITSYFGNRVAPKEGASTDHKGIDIGASMGASVIAAADGRVTTVDYNSARGYYIVIDHGNGYATLYQHLSRQDVAVGDMVYQGDQIGAVGDTGISTAPHLHFEIHVNGTPVDPLQYYE